jgi:hypothetical protein
MNAKEFLESKGHTEFSLTEFAGPETMSEHDEDYVINLLESYHRDKMEKVREKVKERIGGLKLLISCPMPPERAGLYKGKIEELLGVLENIDTKE